MIDLYKVLNQENILIAGSILIRGQKNNLEKLPELLHQNEYDVSSIIFEHMTIDHVRAFQESFLLKNKRKRATLVYCDAITNDAQHALLKTLEDRSPHDACIFIVPTHTSLLPTILSRTTTISDRANFQKQNFGQYSTWLNEWLKIPTPAIRRKKLITTVGDEKNENSRENFIDLLENILRETKNQTLKLHILKTLQITRSSGTSMKQLYDYFCGNFTS